jgi:hypothetical protein
VGSTRYSQKGVEQMMDHPGVELRTSLGFVLSFAAAFLITVLLPEERTSFELIEALWVFAMCTGYINHGIWHPEWGTITSGVLGIVATVVMLVVAPMLVSWGWVVVGGTLVITGIWNLSRTQGHSRTHAIIGFFVALGGLVRVLSVYVPTATPAMGMVWMAVVGVDLITLGRELKNDALHYMGVAWILVAVVTYAFRPDWMLPSLAVVFVLGWAGYFLHLYRLLGRTPKLGELISFATRALFLKGLTKPIDQYRVVAILLKGDIAAENAIMDLLSRLGPRCAPIVLLGPTAPTQLSLPKNAKVGWVTTVFGIANLDYPLLAPEDPTSVSVFLAKTLSGVPEGMTPVILGDFLDNMIPHMDESGLYSYYSDLASSARVKGQTLVLVVNADVHDEAETSVVKRFADVIIENREREERGRLVREVRVSNRVDNIHTDWERY